MKTVTRYEIRSLAGNEYSRPMFRALRERNQALRIVRWLKKRGHNAIVSPLKIAA